MLHYNFKGCFSLKLKMISLLMAMVLLCGCLSACDYSDYDSDYDSVDTSSSTHLGEKEDDATTTTTTTKKVVTKKTTTPKKVTTTKLKPTKAPTAAVQMVWIPVSGSKYHSKASCSNMKNPSQITKARAIELGYSPCSRCY